MQGMRDLMRSSLARSLSTLSAEDRLAAALPLVCGSALAGRCEVIALDPESATLHLRVQGRDWLATLLSMRDVLRSDLARTAGVPLTDLRFESDGRNVFARVSTAQIAENALPVPKSRNRSPFPR